MSNLMDNWHAINTYARLDDTYVCMYHKSHSCPHTQGCSGHEDHDFSGFHMWAGWTKGGAVKQRWPARKQTVSWKQNETKQNRKKKKKTSKISKQIVAKEAINHLSLKTLRQEGTQGSHSVLRVLELTSGLFYALYPSLRKGKPNL